MVRFLWYMGAMGLWTLVTFVPAKLLKKRGHAKAEGPLFLLWFLGLALLTAFLFTAYLKGWRAPYEGFKRVGARAHDASPLSTQVSLLPPPWLELTT